MSELDRTTGQGIRRFDARLDAHLRRNLSPEDHERISTSVTCVASLTGDIDKKHRYAILGHKCVYLADVPPKNLRVALHFQDVQSVEMLDDIPDFLKPEEGENTVHVQIRYSRKVKAKNGLLNSLAGRSPSVFRKQKTSDHLTPSLNSPTPLRSSTVSNTPGSPTKPEPTYSYHQTRSKSLSPNTNGSPLVHRSPIQPSSIQSSDYPTYHRPVGVSTHQKSRKMSPISDVQFSVTGSTNAGSCTSISSLSSNPDNDATDSSKDLTKVHFSQKLLSVNQRSHSTNTLTTLGSLSSHQRSSSSNDLHLSPSLTSSHRAGGHHSSLMSISDTVGFNLETNESAKVVDKTEIGVMDLYILQSVSDFYHQFCVAWDNWKIQQILNPSEAQKPSRSPSMPRDRFSHLYVTLKQDLLQSVHTIVAAANLAHELSIASQKYFVIKRLFWEDCELFDFCVDQLRVHLSPTSSISTADRIEYSVILMDVLYQMMKETHHIKKKVVLLTRNTGHALISLSSMIIDNLPKHQSSDPEMVSFASELTEKSCSVLYELLQVCLQAKWPESDQTSLTVTRVVKHLLELPTMMDFCHRMLAYMCSVVGLNPQPVVELEAQGQVTVYHIAFIMDSIARVCSNGLLKTLRAHLVEDFKYYVSVTRAKQALPEGHLSRKTVGFLQTVKTKVLS